LLIDTHVLMWLGDRPDRLSPAARESLGDPDNVVFVSLASIWEIAIKQAKGKLTLDAKAVLDTLPKAFTLLPIMAEHILATRALPHHHGDPFDRLLIAQAKIEGLTIVTHDDAFRPYGVPILWT
jgi:PIN domain nuclease of toxin-antitoxin system